MSGIQAILKRDGRSTPILRDAVLLVAVGASCLPIAPQKSTPWSLFDTSRSRVAPHAGKNSLMHDCWMRYIRIGLEMRVPGPKCSECSRTDRT
jgi:hypothetical protein